MAQRERGGLIGALILSAAILFGGAIFLDVGGLQQKLFSEGPDLPKPAIEPKLPPRAAGAPPPTEITQAWYVDASGYDGGELERQSLRAPMVVYFHKRRCDDCRKFEKEVLAAAEVKTFLTGAVKVRVDPEAGEREGKLARRFGVESLPALLAIPPGAPPHLVPLKREKGLLKPSELVAFCR